MPESQTTRTTEQKVAVFRACFSGLPHVYGTYDPAIGRAWQVKRPVTNTVILAHLQGKRPYGVYLLVNHQTRAVAVDFDVDDLGPPMNFRDGALNYGLATYIERSKSKGYHVWMFLDEAGVPAAKARLVVRRILDEIGQPNTEVFPKHDRLDTRAMYGNYIYAPLFGALVPQGRTVFLDPGNGFRPHREQWHVLENVERITERGLDEIIDLNELTPSSPTGNGHDPARRPSSVKGSFGLPPCAQSMLTEGVTEFQRVSCFRLAVDLKNAGIPFEHAMVVLCEWARRNRPADGKRVITPFEIQSQTRRAYEGTYRSYGCEDPAIQPFCDPRCPVHKLLRTSSYSALARHEDDSLETCTRSMTMSESPLNRPIKEYRVRNLSLAIWQHERTRDGRPVTLHSVTLNKRYRDPDTGEWKDSDSFFPDDLPRLRLLLDKAYEHILLRDTSPASNQDEPVDKFPPSE